MPVKFKNSRHIQVFRNFLNNRMETPSDSDHDQHYDMFIQKLKTLLLVVEKPQDSESYEQLLTDVKATFPKEESLEKLLKREREEAMEL